MANWRIQMVVVAALVSASTGWGQAPRAPYSPIEGNTYKYPITPQAGEWLVCVQTFKDEKPDPNRQVRPPARIMAEELAEYLRTEYKLPAYLYDRGRLQRKEEDERIKALRGQYDELLKQMKSQGIEPDERSKFRVRTFEIMDEFAVLVGKPNRNLKDMETARDFLGDLRKMKPLPDKFSMMAVFADDDANGKKVNQRGFGYINPFQTALVVHNPSIPLANNQADPTKADAFLKEMNASEEYNLLKCSKSWTIVVKMYQGQAQLQTPKKPSIMAQLGFGKKEPELLNASAAQAHSTAEFLRKMKFDAYVMHHRSYSLVTVGQYDSPDDPNLMAAQKSLAGMQLKQSKDVVLETLNAQPLPMKIPK